MSRRLPKATEHTFDEIKRESAPRAKTRTEPKSKPKAKSKAKPRATPSQAARRTSTKADPAKPRKRPASYSAGALRHSQAREIAERYTAYAAVGGIIPFPVVDTLSVVAIIVRMVQELSKLYEVPFQRDRTRAVVAGIIGGVGQAGAGAATMATLMKVVPGPMFYALAVSSIASAALTRAMGRAFILHFETGGTALEFDPVSLQAFFERERRQDSSAE